MISCSENSVLAQLDGSGCYDMKYPECGGKSAPCSNFIKSMAAIILYFSPGYYLVTQFKYVINFATIM